MRYRVIQWATGAMGKTCLRATLDHPGMQLVGLWVSSEAKAGMDGGDIAHRPRTGILATRSIEDIIATDADVVIHAGLLQPPYGAHDEEIARLLVSGKNVISINGYSHPGQWSAERRGRLEAACQAGKASLMGAGLNPGYIGEKIAVTATSICSDVQGIDIAETVDCSAMRNPRYVFDVLGFNADPAAIDPNDSAWGPAAALNGMYTDVLAAMAGRLGWVLDEVSTAHELRPAAEERAVAAGTIGRGRVSSLVWRWHGLAQGQRKLTMTIVWTMDPLPDDLPLWTVAIDGSPGVRINVNLDRPRDARFRTSAEQLGVAGAVMNAIPVVCAAAPGIVSMPLATPWQSREMPP